VVEVHRCVHALVSDGGEVQVVPVQIDRGLEGPWILVVPLVPEPGGCACLIPVSRWASALLAQVLAHLLDRVEHHNLDDATHPGGPCGDLESHRVASTVPRISAPLSLSPPFRIPSSPDSAPTPCVQRPRRGGTSGSGCARGSRRSEHPTW